MCGDPRRSLSAAHLWHCLVSACNLRFPNATRGSRWVASLQLCRFRAEACWMLASSHTASWRRASEAHVEKPRANSKGFDLQLKSAFWACWLTLRQLFFSCIKQIWSTYNGSESLLGKCRHLGRNMVVTALAEVSFNFSMSLSDPDAIHLVWVTMTSN